jgi:hypothetical protein
VPAAIPVREHRDLVARLDDLLHRRRRVRGRGRGAVGVQRGRGARRRLRRRGGAGALGGGAARARVLRDLLRLGGVDDAVGRESPLALVALDVADGPHAVLAVGDEPVAERLQLALEGAHVGPAHAAAQRAGARGAGRRTGAGRRAGTGGGGPAAGCRAAGLVPGGGASAGGGAEDDGRRSRDGDDEDERAPVRS